MEPMDGLEEQEDEAKAQTTNRSPNISIQPAAAWQWPSSTSSILVVFFILFLTTAFLFRIDFPIFTGRIELPSKCPQDYPKEHNPDRPSNLTCPSYFKWIHEDLRPWKEKGISRDMIDRARTRRTGHFRLVILDGKVYVKKYRKAIQTRDVFTLWGILQLLRWYPGRLPDLELLFDCGDRPAIRSEDFMGPNAGPPPLFRYCSDRQHSDIVFPDWSFWGWAEVNIRPWQNLLKDLKEGNKRSKWKDRVPYAYWKGNPYVAQTRQDLLKCNVSDKNGGNTRLYIQDWIQESKQGYKQSNLEDQCTHRYKIYIDGWAWSVSEKYILACDAMNLFVASPFHDFFIRGMVPLQHYWPIRDNSKCTSLNFAVEWGNNHTQEAQAIGNAGARFVQEDIKMEYVYDYMFHVLNEYAKLLQFTPIIPRGVVEVCSETLSRFATGTHKKFMVESMVMTPSSSTPCNLPPAYDPQALGDFIDTKLRLTKQVETWENEYRQNLN